jgi:hypothetical protein
VIERAKDLPGYLAGKDLGNKQLHEILTKMKRRIKYLKESLPVT